MRNRHRMLCTMPFVGSLRVTQTEACWQVFVFLFSIFIQAMSTEWAS